MPNPVDSLCMSVIALATVTKQTTQLLLQTTQDVNGLRESVKGLDPTFSEVYAQNRKKVDKDSQLPQTIAALQVSLDELIDSLREMLAHLS